MSWFRRLIRSIIVGIIAAIGGIFGNLAATVAQETFFQINIVTIVATIVGMILAILLHAAIENWPDIDAEKLHVTLEEHRDAIKMLHDLRQAGQVWTDYHAFNWREHQAKIASIKQELNNKGLQVAYSRWDDYPQPKVGRFIRLIEAIKQGVLFFIMFGIAFVFVLSINNVVHQTYLTIVRQFTSSQPVPIVQPEVTLPPVFTAVLSPTTTVETLTLPEATPPLLAPSATPTVTVPTLSEVFENTPTALPKLQVSGFSSINYRSGPGLQYASDGILFEGDIVELVAKNSNASWYLIQLDDGTRGWLSSSVVDFVENASLETIPIAATIPPLPTPTATVIFPPEFIEAEIIPIDTLRLSWTWERSLKEDEFFVIRLWPVDGISTKQDVVRLKESTYAMKINNTQFPAGNYYLSVIVISSPFLTQGDEAFTTITQSNALIIYIPSVSLTPTIPTPVVDCPPQCG